MADVTTVASRFPVIRPELLGRMLVLETIDTDTIIAARMAKFVEYWKAADPPSAATYDVAGLEFDPIKILEELSTYFELMLRDRVNQAARSVTLAFAVGTDLDAIASRYPGGVPRQVGETDDAYRRRIWLSPNLLSPHGSFEAYVFWALSAGAGVRDASALTVPGTGVVNLYLMNDGQTYTVSDAQVSTVYKYVSDKSRKGLTDVLRVMSAQIVHTTIEAQVWMFPGVDSATALTEINAALLALVESNRWIGTDLTIMAIEACLAQSGVYNAKIKSPVADIVVEKNGAVKVDSIKITYMGIGE